MIARVLQNRGRLAPSGFADALNYRSDPSEDRHSLHALQRIQTEAHERVLAALKHGAP